MRAFCRRALCALLCVLAFSSMCPLGADAVTDYSLCSNKGVMLEFPEELLEGVHTARTKAAKKNGSVSLLPRPGSGNGDMGTIKDGHLVVILAEKDDYYFFMTVAGKLAWNQKKYFTGLKTVESGYLNGKRGLTASQIRKLQAFLLDGNCGMASPEFYAARSVLVLNKTESQSIPIHRTWGARYDTHYDDKYLKVRWIGTEKNAKVQIVTKKRGVTYLELTNDGNDQAFMIMIIVT